MYERALAYVSTDYQASVVWEKYLEFEQEHGTTQHVAALYPRMLACPMKQLEKLYQSFQQYVGPRTVQELLSEDQIATLRDSILPRKQQQQQEFAAAAAAVKQAAAAAATAAAVADAAVKSEEPAVKTEGTAGDEDTGTAAAEEGKDTEMADAPPADDGEAAAAPAGEAEAADPAAAAAATEAAEATPPAAPAEAAPDAAAGLDAAGAAPVKEEEAAAAAAEPSAMEVQVTVSDEEVKAAWTAQCTAIYEATKSQLLPPRQPFEAVIKRPYYHVKPLDPAQLKNWVAYLTWSEAQGDVAGTIHLYERCLVACANYPGEGGGGGADGGGGDKGEGGCQGCGEGPIAGVGRV